MKTNKNFERVVYGYWARRFNCTTDELYHPGTVIVEEEELAETERLIIYHIKQASVVRISPNLAEQTGLIGHFDRGSVSLTADALQSLVGTRYRVERVNRLLDCYLRPEAFKPIAAADNFATRRLYPEQDNALLFGLFDACTEEDLDEAEIYVDDPDPVIYGMLDGDQLVAYASHRYWDEIIADIGVLIHPNYRSRGLGKAVVSALCDWCIENDVVPMYRVFSDHTHSLRLSQALGFVEMVAVESVALATD